MSVVCGQAYVAIGYMTVPGGYPSMHCGFLIYFLIKTWMVVSYLHGPVTYVIAVIK